MKKIIILLALVIYSSTILGAELSTISLSDWNKEVISSDHLRFTHPQKKGIIIHLQIDSFNENNSWKEQTLPDDIKEMANIREKTASVLGMTDYKINFYKFDGPTKTSSLSRLSLTGSYHRLDNQLINFSETNFYYKKQFLQIKIMSEGKLPSHKETEAIINAINPSSVNIK